MPYFGDRQSSRRSGFSLAEMLLVVSVLSVLTLMAVPRLERAVAARDLVAAKAAISAVFLRARAAAVDRRQSVLFTVDGGVASASATSPSGPVLVAEVPLRTQFSVQVTAPGRSLLIEPTGLIRSGTPFVIRLARSTLTDSVRITGYGRVE